jgi:hypothetical protein
MVRLVAEWRVDKYGDKTREGNVTANICWKYSTLTGLKFPEKKEMTVENVVREKEGQTAN